MHAKLDERLAAIGAMGLAALRTEWRGGGGGGGGWGGGGGVAATPPPPPAFKTDLLARGIAHKLQDKGQGGLSRSHLRLITAEVAALAGGQPARHVIAPKPGTRLSRAWHGEVYHVLVLAKGYEFRGQRYASLSNIARLITGATWSGPRFFGLTSSKGTKADA
jgi:Protein of unknown function (DUF2924)